MTAVLSAGLFTFCSQECAGGIARKSTASRRRFTTVWSQQGLWQKMFYELSQIVGTHYENSIDSTAIKAHRSARGKKGAKTKRLAQAGVAARQKSMR